jgi:protein-tyrosine phosphatase
MKKNNKQKNSTTTTTTTAFALPPLPKPVEVDVKIYRGPTSHTNWIIPGKFLCGSFPRSKVIRDLLDVGCNIFVNLTMPNETQRYGSYIEFAEAKSKKSIKYIPFPIYDHNVGREVEVVKLVQDLEAMILAPSNDVIYIHCIGGHGRTGTIVSLLLAKLYKLDAFAAMEVCQALHDTRQETNGRVSPESTVQRNQVHKLVPKIGGGNPSSNYDEETE